MKDPLKNNQHFGRYELKRPLGHGGMGVVYLAWDPELSRNVAIKCVEKISSEKKLAKRLRVEAKMMAQLNNSNIVQLYDVIESDNVLGLVIEYVEGASLLDKCRELLPNHHLRINWLIQIAEGLATAHQAGVTHCDLKPENVLISNEGVVKIADFGIAKARLSDVLSDEGLTEPDKVSGSYFSLSPEQAMGAKVDFRTDLFSFGILCHLLLLGRHPFGETNNHLLIVQRIINDQFKLIPDPDNTLSPELGDLISSLLEKNPDHRPKNAETVAACLRNELKRLDGEDCDPEDLTMEFSVNQLQRQKFKPIAIIAASIVLIISIVAGYFVWKEFPVKTQYIAIIKPTVSTPDNFDEGQKKRIGATIEHSLQEALLSIESLSLIPNTKLADYEGDPTKLAIATGADAVLLTTADCTLLECEVRLQKLAGEKWEVVEQRVWPVIAESLSDIRATTFVELGQLFPENTDTRTGNQNKTISEENYRRYLKVYHSSSGGVDPTEDRLTELESILINTPSFIPAYSLYGRLAIQLFKRTEQERPLENFNKILFSTPENILNNQSIIKLRFELLIAQNNLSQATEYLDELEVLMNNRVFINDLKGSLAYAKNDYQLALDLDLENTILRPSTQRFYNLAVSQFLQGDLVGSKTSIQKALSLYPNHSLSNGLQAAIALTEGNVSLAIESYKNLVKSNPSFINLTNYGLSLALDKRYLDAIDIHIKAIKLNPNNPASRLNLADSYDLNGDVKNAKSNYLKVINVTNNPTSLQDFSARTQAQAHLGQFNESIKTLRNAKTFFSSTNELNYAAAITYTLSGNHSAAIVEIEAALKSGTGEIWFRFAWFQDLCLYPTFEKLIKTAENSICKQGNVS